MSYAQVRDILSRVREGHQRFRDTLAHIEQESNNDGTEWIAKSFRQHEQHWQMALAKSGGDDQDAILNTWIQVVPSEELFSELDDIVVTPEMTLDDVVAAAVGFHSALVNLYRTLSTQVSAPRAKEFLTSLLEYEQTVVAQQAWAARKE